MPSFLSKVFGRKKDEKVASSARGRGHDGASLLGGKFEAVSPVASYSLGEFPENTSRSRPKDSGSRLANVKSPAASSPKSADGKDEFLHLPLSIPHSREDGQARDLGIVFESSSEAQLLSDDVTANDRRLTPIEALILVRICSQAIVARGLETLGLMHPQWHSASPETQHRLITLFIRSLNANSPQTPADSSSFSLFETEIDYTLSPHDVAAVLRWGLRHLELGADGFGKEKTWYRTFTEAERKGGYPVQSYSETLTPLIPATHLELLNATLDLFSSLAAHSEENSTSASKLTKAFGFWLLTAQRDRERDNWVNFYDSWQSSGRVLEHVFLARIRDQSLKTRMPTRLMELVARYPYVEAERLEDVIFLHPQLSTRQSGALLVRVESEPSPQEHAHRHPLQLLKDALGAQVVGVYDNELVLFWEKIQKSGNDESEAILGGYPGISHIFDDDALRYLSLVPGTHPWKKPSSPTLNHGENQDSPTFRRVASSPGSTENEGRNGSTNGHAKHNTDPASPSSVNTSTSPSDWFQFSSAGFADITASTLPLASTLFGQDVEKTNPPFHSRRSSKRRSRSPSRARKSIERTASPPPPPVPDLPQQYAQKPIFKSTGLSLVKIDEAFIDFWTDALLESVSFNWPKFVLCKLRSDLSDLVVNDQRIEYVVIEHVKGGLATPSHASTAAAAVDVLSAVSTPPMTIPSTPAEQSNLERTTSPTKSLPSSPRSFKSEKQRFFNLFSSSLSPSGGSRSSGIYASATTSRGKKQKEAAASVGELGEIGKEKEKEKEKRLSTIVKLRMPSPRGRKSMDAPRRSVDLSGSSNVGVPEQARGRSTGEKKEVEVEKKGEEAERKEDEKAVKFTERKMEAEGKEKKDEDKTGEVVEGKKREVEEEKKVESKKGDSLSEIPSIATGAVAATAVAVAAVTTSGSQQTTSEEDAHITEDIQPVERQTEEAVVGQEAKEESSLVANFEEQPARVPETVVENPVATEPTPVLTNQTLSASCSLADDATRDTAAESSETVVAKESAIQLPATQESETGVVTKPIGKEELVSESVAPEPVTEVIEPPVSLQGLQPAAEPVMVQVTPEPIAAEQRNVVEEPAASSPPSLEPQIVEGKSAPEPEAAAAVSEPEKVVPQPVSAATAESTTTPVSHPTIIELTPVAEEPTKDAHAVTEEPIAAKASSATPEPAAAEELFIIEGPAAFDPSDIDAQVEEMNAQVPEEIVDSDPTSEEDSESLVDEESSPVDAESLSPIQETNEGEPLTEDAIEDVVEEPAVSETPVEEAVVAPSKPLMAEVTTVPETPVAEEKDNVVPLLEEEEDVAEAAPVQEEPVNQVVTVTEPLGEPVSPVVESSIAADERHADETPTATTESTSSTKPIVEEAAEEPATTEAHTQDVPSGPVVAAESVLVVEESTGLIEEAVVEMSAPTVEEDYVAEDSVKEENSTPAAAHDQLVSHEAVPSAASQEEHHAIEEPVVVDNKEVVMPEQPVARGVSDEASSSDVIPGDQPAVMEETTEAPVEEGPTVTQPAVAGSTPVYAVFEEPERIEEPPTQEQADESHPVEAITEPSVEGLQASTAEKPIAEADVTEIAEAEIVDQPATKDLPTEPAKEFVAGAPAAEEPPVAVEEPPVVVEVPFVNVEVPSDSQPAEAATNPPDAHERPTAPSQRPVSEAIVTERSAPEDEVSPTTTRPVDTTSVIDEDAIDAAAAKPAEPAATPPTTVVVEEHEVTSIPDEPSTSTIDNSKEVSNGNAEHVPASGVANGNGHHAIMTEKESASDEHEHNSNELPESVPVIVED